MTTNSVVWTIAKSLTEFLVLEMKDLISQYDETRAGLVRPGLLQQSPLEAGINILIQENDPDDEKGWRHTIAHGGVETMAGIHLPTYSIGGGAHWFRRYTLKLEQFFRAGSTRERAEELSSIILSRAELALRTAPLPDTDSFGETPIQLYVHSSINIEGGGPGQWIFHGTIFFQVLTEKE